MISVCIAMHNGGKYIIEELNTILPQLGPNDEVIISDDGSTDGSLSLVESYCQRDNRVRMLIRVNGGGQKPHYYVTKNFENALKYSKGEYIFLADQDDLWFDNKVKECIKYLSDYDVVVHELTLCDELGKPMGKTWYGGNFHYHDPLKIHQHGYQGCAMAFRRKILSAALPFPSELLVHDQWIGCIGEAIGKAKFISEPLMYYRIHGDNVSGNYKSNNNIATKVEYRLYFIKELIKRLLKYKLA